MTANQLFKFNLKRIRKVERMKLKYAIEMVEMQDEIIGVPVGQDIKCVNGVLKMNSTGKAIIELLREKTTTERIIDIIASHYEDERSIIETYVNDVIRILRYWNLIEDE